MSPQRNATETSIRQLIANGKSKAALDSAKEFHKKINDADSEKLLIDAYVERVRALSDQNLALEAKSLSALVRERFPAARQRLDALNAGVAAQAGDLHELLKPLNDSDLSPERRALIEEAIQSKVTDMASLAACEALPPQHPLRIAAASIDQAFHSVTSGPVTDEQIALPEVSRRSPLANWKLLIRAIACFYRNQDQGCEEALAAISHVSAPARLLPAMRAMLAAGPGPHPHLAVALKPAETALVAHACPSLRELRHELAGLDRAFLHGQEPSQIFKAIRRAVRECSQNAPALLEELRQKLLIRGGIVNLDSDRLLAALEGEPRVDASFFRNFAIEFEAQGDDRSLTRACDCWDDFRAVALREGWFAKNSPEMAALYLHMAELLSRITPAVLREVQEENDGPKSATGGNSRDPNELYSRACLIDPHSESFSQWLQWAKRKSTIEAENVARVWSKTVPTAIEPLLFLMAGAEKRNAFPTALSYLNKAERIDAVDPTVRTARLRLLAASALRHLQQKKPHLAAQRLAELCTLPQSLQGDRPAFLGALRTLISLAIRDQTGVNAGHDEVERAFGDDLTAMVFVFGCASCVKMNSLVKAPWLKELSEPDRARFPVIMARVIALAMDLGLVRNFKLPIPYFHETASQFPRAAASLSVEQIRTLGELGLATHHPRLAWAASAAGLERGGSTEAYFLLLRSRALPDGLDDRYEALVSAAAELGRIHRDMEVVGEAVEDSHASTGEEPASLTADQARDVLRRERASPAYPTQADLGPDYSDLFPGDLCMCPDCCRERGEAFDPELEDSFPALNEPLDEELLKRSFFEAAPKDIPRDLLPGLFEAAKSAFLRGEDPTELLAEMLSGAPPKRRKNKKGGRK